MYKHLKPVLDFVFAALGLSLMWPLMLLVALAVRLDSPGPVWFAQRRPGKQGAIFTLFKFRTMRSETHGHDGQPLSDLARMTRVGRVLRKTSLDELPQLINILKGEMSFVGPRPLLVEYLPLYTPEQMRRHNVRPGITGWAQVNGRNSISWEDKFALDLEYVARQGFILDVRIVLLTVHGVLTRKGVQESPQVTMSEYKGSATQG